MTPSTATNSNQQFDDTFDVEIVANNRPVEETIFDDETASEPQAQGPSVIQATKNFFLGKVLTKQNGMIIFVVALALFALMGVSSLIGASMSNNKFVASLNSAQPPLTSKSTKGPTSKSSKSGGPASPCPGTCSDVQPPNVCCTEFYAELANYCCYEDGADEAGCIIACNKLKHEGQASVRPRINYRSRINTYYAVSLFVTKAEA